MQEKRIVFLNLNNNLFEFSGYIEQYIKATFIQTLCSEYKGILQKGECYLDKSIYEDDESFQLLEEMITKRLERNKSC